MTNCGVHQHGEVKEENQRKHDRADRGEQADSTKWGNTGMKNIENQGGIQSGMIKVYHQVANIYGI